MVGDARALQAGNPQVLVDRHADTLTAQAPAVSAIPTAIHAATAATKSSGKHSSTRILNAALRPTWTH
jgi:hypothetical protein